MPTHHNETLLERYQREHRVYEGMNMSKAEELTGTWANARTTLDHVRAGNSMAAELRRLSAINAELTRVLERCVDHLRGPTAWTQEEEDLLLGRILEVTAKAQGEQL